MARTMTSTTDTFETTAKVVDGALILSMPDARSPTVWRMDLGQAKESALELQPQEGGAHRLVQKTPNGQSNEIASYDDKATALRALMAISRAMETGHGQQGSQTQNYPGNPSRFQPQQHVDMGRGFPQQSSQYGAPARSAGRNWLTALAGVIVLIALLAAIMRMGAGHVALPPQDDQAADATATTGASGGTGPVSAPGVPVSADSFLQNR